MCTAAKLNGIAAVPIFAHSDNSNLLAVFLTKQRQRSGINSIFQCHQTARNLGIRAYPIVDRSLNSIEFLSINYLRVAEIEAQIIWCDQGTLLRNMVT